MTRQRRRRRPVSRLAGIALLGCLAATQAGAQPGPDRWLILEDLVLIDGTGAAPRRVAELVARNGIVLGADQAAARPSPFDQVTRVALDGAVVLPGLIDSHVHLSGFPGDRESIEMRMRQALRGGVTSVRDMAGDARVLADTQRATLRGEFAGLSVAYAAVIGGPAMFADPRITLASVGYEPGTAPWALSVDAETDLQLALSRARGSGASAVKIYGNLDASQVMAVAREARRQGLAIWAHATVFPAAPGDLLDAGVDVLSHAPYLIWAAVDRVPDDYGARREGPYRRVPADHPRVRALLERMATSGTMLDTTLLVYRDAILAAEGEERGAWSRDAYAWGVAVTALAHRLGVPIAAGTDRFTRDDWSLPDLHEELAILVDEAGLAPMDALIAATSNAARAAGLDPRRGTLEPGKAADIVVLGSDPLGDIRATRDIRVVIKDGEIVVNHGLTGSGRPQ